MDLLYRLLNIPLGKVVLTDKAVIRAQKLRLKRFGLSVVTYMVAILATFLITCLGIGQLTPVQWATLISAILVGISLFFVLFYTNLNLRFPEPSLTREQIVYSTVYGVFAMYWLPEARPIILLFFLPPFTFGVLSLTFRQYLDVVVCVLGLYAALLGFEYFQNRQGFDTQYQIFLFVLFGLLLTWFSFFGGFVSNIRHRLREQKEEIKKANEEIMIKIEAHKKAEEALRKSEAKYKHIFKSAPAGIYEIDFEKGKFIDVNQLMCKFTGYSEEELLSMDPLNLLTADSKNRYFEKISKGSDQHEGNVEYDIIKKNGQESCVILNSDLVYTNGQVTGARVVTHDITELKKAQKEKDKAQQILGEHKKLALVGQIAGKMAHDFNNILGVIMGNAELELMGCRDEETRKTFELILTQTLRGKNLTKNLVAFAKDQEPKQEFFRINEKVDLVVNLLKKDLEGIELIREDQTDIPDLLADAGMVEHAMINLIQNSIHATSMSAHPRIVIRTYCLDENICFEVEDNGCGIPKEYLEKIYEPSFTLKGTKDVTGSYGNGIKGTGYGMANVKKYIEQHQGDILVDSVFGSGIKFTICLPVIKQELFVRKDLD